MYFKALFFFKKKKRRQLDPTCTAKLYMYRKKNCYGSVRMVPWLKLCKSEGFL